MKHLFAIALILAACASSPPDYRKELGDLIRVYGFAAVQVFGEGFAAEAPELFRLADRNSDGVLTEEEILAIDPTSPVFAVVVLQTIKRLRK